LLKFLAKNTLISKLSATSFVISFLFSTITIAADTPAFSIPDGAEKWRPVTVTPTENLLWNREYARPQGKLWSSIIWITNLTLEEHPISERFEQEETLVIKVKQHENGSLKIVDIVGDFLPQSTKTTLGKALHINIQRYWASEKEENRELLTDSFAINIPLPSNATRRYAIEAMKYIMFERCIRALEKTGHPDINGMTEIPLGKYGNGTLKSKWSSRHFPMPLDIHETHYKDRPYLSCVFQNPFDGMPTYINENTFADQFEKWTNTKEISSTYETPKNCQNSEKNKHYISKNATAPGQYIKVAYINYDEKGRQFLLAAASQNDHEMCK